MKENVGYRYRELVKELNLPQLRGSRQQKQLKDLFQIYKIEKIDGKYYYRGEYTEVEKIENQTYHKYESYITPLIYILLTYTENNFLSIDMKHLLIKIKALNEDFYVAKYNKEKTDIILFGNDFSRTSYFCDDVEPMLKRIVKDILKKMENMKLISVSKFEMFGESFVDEKTKNVYTRNVESTKDTREMLLRFQQLALQDIVHKYKNKDLLNVENLNYYQTQEFKTLTTKYLKEKSAYSYYYYRYDITLNKKGLSEHTTNDYAELSQSFNKTIQEKVRKSKSKKLLMIDDKDKEIYIKELIDSSKEPNLKQRL